MTETQTTTTTTLHGTTYTVGEDMLLRYHNENWRDEYIICTVTKTTPKTVEFSDGTRLTTTEVMNEKYHPCSIRPATEEDKARIRWEEDTKNRERLVYKYSTRLNDHTATSSEKHEYAQKIRDWADELTALYQDEPAPIEDPREPQPPINSVRNHENTTGQEQN